MGWLEYTKNGGVSQEINSCFGGRPGKQPPPNLQNSFIEHVLRTHSLKELTFGTEEREHADHEMSERAGKFKVS
jgi:hypothetical protein